MKQADAQTSLIQRVRRMIADSKPKTREAQAQTDHSGAVRVVKGKDDGNLSVAGSDSNEEQLDREELEKRVKETDSVLKATLQYKQRLEQEN